jgi:hypothetical protein
LFIPDSDPDFLRIPDPVSRGQKGPGSGIRVRNIGLIFMYYWYIIFLFLRTQVEKYPNGNFVGPTVINNMTTDMDAYKQEIFGPVLCVINVDTLDDAIELINRQISGIFWIRLNW